MLFPAVKTYGIEQGIPVLQPEKIKDIAQAVQNLDSPVGVLVSFGKIIPEAVLQLFTLVLLIYTLLCCYRGYRGPSPIESAILHRDNKTGVSVMLLDKAMDAGPIYLQVPTRSILPKPSKSFTIRYSRWEQTYS